METEKKIKLELMEAEFKIKRNLMVIEKEIRFEIMAREHHNDIERKKRNSVIGVGYSR
jgi:hypothetical protein